MADHVVIIGGGPGGYEAAHVAAQLGAEVTVVDTDGIGGSAVLTDCVPSKTLIATSELMTDMSSAQRARASTSTTTRATPPRRSPSTWPRSTPASSSSRRTSRPTSRPASTVTAYASCRVVAGWRADLTVAVTTADGDETLQADAIIVATGAAPRTLPSAQPDGERILTWEQVYDLTEVPEKLIVVGSGVTGAEFANAYLSLGVDVTLVQQPRPGAARRGRRCLGGARGGARPGGACTCWASHGCSR